MEIHLPTQSSWLQTLSSYAQKLTQPFNDNSLQTQLPLIQPLDQVIASLNDCYIHDQAFHILYEYYDAQGDIQQITLEAKLLAPIQDGHRLVLEALDDQQNYLLSLDQVLMVQATKNR